jgi:ribonuclease D
MKNSPLPPPELIQTKHALTDLISDLRQQPQLAVDTESNSLHAYKEEVCLIQFSYPGRDVLVDPIKLGSIKPLGELFSDPTIQKVMHGAEYDIGVLKRDFSIKINNLFDTRIACRTLGWKNNGLRSLVERMFEVEINKRFQRANWGKRPLSEAMLDYARLDTHYLIEMQDRLVEMLEEKDLLGEMLEFCEYMTLADAHEIHFDPNGFWRIRKARHLSPQGLAILRELYVYRDQQARQMDRPAFKVISDKTLFEIADQSPKNLEQLGEISGMTKGQVHRHGKSLLAAVRRGRKASPPRYPHNKNNHHSEDISNRYDLMHDWRKNTAKTRGVESDIILPREIMREIARQNPIQPSRLKQLMQPLPIRYNHYGDEILEILKQVEKAR